MEVLAHDDQLGGQLVDDDAVHEVLGRLLGAHLVEVDEDRRVDVRGVQQLELLLE